MIGLVIDIEGLDRRPASASPGSGAALGSDMSGLAASEAGSLLGRHLRSGAFAGNMRLRAAVNAAPRRASVARALAAAALAAAAFAAAALAAALAVELPHDGADEVLEVVALLARVLRLVVVVVVVLVVDVVEGGFELAAVVENLVRLVAYMVPEVLVLLGPCTAPDKILADVAGEHVEEVRLLVGLGHLGASTRFVLPEGVLEADDAVLDVLELSNPRRVPDHLPEFS